MSYLQYESCCYHYIWGHLKAAWLLSESSIGSSICPLPPENCIFEGGKSELVLRGAGTNTTAYTTSVDVNQRIQQLHNNAIQWCPDGRQNIHDTTEWRSCHPRETGSRRHTHSLSFEIKLDDKQTTFACHKQGKQMQSVMTAQLKF